MIPQKIIPQSTIQQIKNQLDFLEFLKSLSIKLKWKSGNEYNCRCPFPDHEDKNPSFSVNKEKKIFHCFGCGKSGDPISFVEQYFNLSFPNMAPTLIAVYRSP